MTLTNRVSSFFLGWLGFSLVGFAIAVYLLVRAELYHQVDDRLESMLDTLTAAAEVSREGIEWEPEERRLIRPSDADQTLAWVVASPTDPAIDQAGKLDITLELQGELLGTTRDRGELRLIDRDSPRYRFRTCQLQSPGYSPPAEPVQRWITVPHQRGKEKYPEISIGVAVSLEPVHAQLRHLAMWLTLNTVILWLLAALIGRWLCRRTLAPVTNMAQAAAALGPQSPGERLDVKSTDDELEDLGLAFNGALDRLEEAFDRQQRFTGDAAHQLRTPLAAMLGQVEVALRRDRDGTEYRDTLQTIAGEIRHLHRLTESLLFLARADADAAHPDLQELDPSDFVKSHLADWGTRFPNVRIENDGTTSNVRAHPELLTQLVENLLDNAVKYGPKNGPVIVRLGPSELAVEDTGPGISAADLPHIFDPFFRSASAREAGIGGVGLGLAIAKRIAGALRAELRAESVKERGSRFTIRFTTAST